MGELTPFRPRPSGRGRLVGLALAVIVAFVVGYASGVTGWIGDAREWATAQWEERGSTEPPALRVNLASSVVSNTEEHADLDRNAPAPSPTPTPTAEPTPTPILGLDLSGICESDECAELARAVRMHYAEGCDGWQTYRTHPSIGSLYDEWLEERERLWKEPGAQARHRDYGETPKDIDTVEHIMVLYLQECRRLTQQMNQRAERERNRAISDWWGGQ